ncbi:integrase core domain-containing protein [Phthorimaea operculella]|nr:integrase core domain-containing protein [Phthorimaea operculella]
MFNFEIKHKKGSENLVPDLLSRNIPNVNIINSSSTTDEWYISILNKCKNNPSSTPDYTIKDNKLYKYTNSLTPFNSQYSWKLVVPSEHRNSIIAQNHCTPTAAHFGTFKTYHRIKLNYFWPGMYKDVATFISRCDTCLAYKHSNQNAIGLMGEPKQCSRPFQCLSIDFIGPLPISRKLNRYILVITCCFSKYCLLFPIKRATSSVIKHVLEDLVFMNYGIPETVILDNGPQMTSPELTDMFHSYKIPHIHFIPLHCPQVNTVERYNRTIITAVASFVNDDHRTWDKHLHKIQFAINSSVNESTKFTPAFLVFGRELVPCGSTYSQKDTTDDLIFAPRDIYAENLGQLIPIFDKVQSRLHSIHQNNASHYNKHRQNLEFEPGDIVWKRNYPISSSDKNFSAKLAPKYIKCIVSQKISPLVYNLTDTNNNNLGRWHIKDLKPTKTAKQPN